MRLIDADKLKENIEYALLQHEDTEKWLKWFNQVIDAESTVEMPWYKKKQSEDKKIEAEREEIKKDVERIFSDMFGQEVKILG